MTVEKVRNELQRYADIDAAALMENLCYFQKEISETALECGVKLAIHPDDPPFSIMGLPRIVNNISSIIIIF